MVYDMKKERIKARSDECEGWFCPQYTRGYGSERKKDEKKNVIRE